MPKCDFNKVENPTALIFSSLTRTFQAFQNSAITFTDWSDFHRLIIAIFKTFTY